MRASLAQLGGLGARCKRPQGGPGAQPRNFWASGLIKALKWLNFNHYLSIDLPSTLLRFSLFVTSSSCSEIKVTTLRWKIFVDQSPQLSYFRAVAMRHEATSFPVPFLPWRYEGSAITSKLGSNRSQMHKLLEARSIQKS